MKNVGYKCETWIYVKRDLLSLRNWLILRWGMWAEGCSSRGR